MRRNICWIIVVFMILPVLLAASHKQAVQAMERDKLELKDSGFTVTSGITGVLAEDESVTMATTLYRGNEYAFQISGDHSVVDIGIYIFDENGIQLATNFGRSLKDPLVMSCKQTGTYFIKIKIYKTVDGGQAYYGYAAGYQPVKD